jgi:4-amino-4-deoxy-L-arabinose transferase-like glycosyltransferase
MNNNEIINDGNASLTRVPYIFLLVIVVMASVLRFGFAVRLPAETIWPDGDRYNKIAQNILSNKQYPAQESHSAPLLPLLLAGIYGLIGFNGTAARIVMALLGTLTCLVVYGIGKQLFGTKSGIIASLVLAFYPFHAYLSSIYEYPQTIFIFILCLAVYELISSFQTPSSSVKLIFSGLFFGLSVLTVPTIVTVLPFIAMWLLFYGRKTWRNRVLQVCIFSISCVTIVFLWSAYIYAGTGKFQLGSGAGAEALFKGNCSLSWQMGKADIADMYDIEGVPVEQRKAYEEYQSVEKQARQFPAGPERDSVYNNAVKRFFTERPKEAGLLLLRKAVLYWCPYAMTVTRSSHNNNLTKVIQIISFSPIFILALFSIYLQKSKLSLLMPIYIIVVLQWLTYTVYIINARYRAQVDVFLIVLAAPVIVSIVTRIHHVMFSAHENTYEI